MISHIQIANMASYGVEPQKMASLKATDFIYGANGSGKTTISRIIADHQKRM